MQLQPFDQFAPQFFGNLMCASYRTPTSLELRYRKHPPLSVALALLALAAVILIATRQMPIANPAIRKLFAIFPPTVALGTVALMLYVYRRHWAIGPIVSVDLPQRSISLFNAGGPLSASDLDHLCIIDTWCRYRASGRQYCRYVQLCFVRKITALEPQPQPLLAAIAYGPCPALRRFASDVSRELNLPLEIHENLRIAAAAERPTA